MVTPNPRIALEGVHTGAEHHCLVADVDLLQLRCEQAHVRADRDIALIDAPHQQRPAPQQPRLMPFSQEPRCRLRVAKPLINKVHLAFLARPANAARTSRRVSGSTRL
jgi:hypothetical protein